MIFKTKQIPNSKVTRDTHLCKIYVSTDKRASIRTFVGLQRKRSYFDVLFLFFFSFPFSLKKKGGEENVYAKEKATVNEIGINIKFLNTHRRE